MVIAFNLPKQKEEITKILFVKNHPEGIRPTAETSTLQESKKEGEK